jgi:hypothetical protein
MTAGAEQRSRCHRRRPFTRLHHLSEGECHDRPLVDGTVRGTATVPAGLSVDNTAPLTLGGKGLSDDNDQFHGALDDAWVSIDRATAAA